MKSDFADKEVGGEEDTFLRREKKKNERIWEPSSSSFPLLHLATSGFLSFFFSNRYVFHRVQRIEKKN